MLVLVKGSVDNMFRRTLVYVGSILGSARACHRTLGDVAFHSTMYCLLALLVESNSRPPR